MMLNRCLLPGPPLKPPAGELNRMRVFIQQEARSAGEEEEGQEKQEQEAEEEGEEREEEGEEGQTEAQEESGERQQRQLQ